MTIKLPLTVLGRKVFDADNNELLDFPEHRSKEFVIELCDRVNAYDRLREALEKYHSKLHELAPNNILSATQKAMSMWAEFDEEVGPLLASLPAAVTEEEKGRK